jgi:transposase
MRGKDDQLQTGMYSYVSLEERVPGKHPLRAIRKLVDDVLNGMSGEFDNFYAKTGRPSIPPERLLRALLLQVFYSIRSERMLMEQLEYNLLLRWFVGLEIDDEIWNHAVFSKDRERLLNQEVAQSFFARVKAQAAGLMSDEHFTVDGTLMRLGPARRVFKRKMAGIRGRSHEKASRHSKTACLSLSKCGGRIPISRNSIVSAHLKT